MTDIPNPTPDLASARQMLDGFLSGIPTDARQVGMHDSDADGVSAGVVWQRALERSGFTDVVRLTPDRERSPWTDGNRDRLRDAKPERLWVMDLGSRAEPVLPNVPLCLIDHHRPDGVPPGASLITGYHWDPIPNTSLLVYQLWEGRVDLSGLDWIAAVGIIGDLGERAPFPVLEAAKKAYTAKYLKEVTSLINAARRAASYDPDGAARALLAYDSPRALALSEADDVQKLRTAQAEVKAAMEEAKKAAPTFAGNVALIRVYSDCQIHPLVAQIWRTRLPKFLVLAANDGYLPGRVNFSARSLPGINALDVLKSVKLPEGEGNFGNGHDQASGGSLPPDRWNLLLEGLGFPSTVYAKVP